MWRRDAGAQARRDPVRVRGADGRAQGTARPGDDPRDGQGPRRGARRRPGGHRYRLPDGRRGPPDGRRDGPVRAPRQVGDEHPPAARRGRDHHALELPDGDPVLEDDARAGDRQHGRVQAVVRHAALRDAPRRADGRGRLPARRRQPRHRRGRRGRRRHRRQPGRAGHLVHRARRRPASDIAAARRAVVSSASRSSSAARTASSSSPTPTSTSPPTGSSGRRSGRPASAARPPRGSSSNARVVEPLLERARDARPDAPARLRARSGGRRRPAHQRRRARQGRLVRRHRPRRGRAGRSAADRRPATTCRTATSSSRRSSPAVGAMDRIGQEEIFGPVLSVIPVDDYGAAMLALNQTRYGLSSSIFTRDVNTGLPRDARLRDRDRLRQRRHDRRGGRTCRSVAGRRPATATARPATSRSTRTPSGSRSTSTSRGRLQRAQIDNQPG